ncbi:MAG: response regulator [Endomicrobiales bacterium]|nr:response regulator [Endomicrobiales bacterium]
MNKINREDLKILIIDDEKGIRDLLNYELGSQGYTVLSAKDGDEGLEMLKQNNIQLVISDVKMPKMDGIRMLEEAKKINPDIEVIMATGYGTIETAVQSMKIGAYDFIQKPFNIDEILLLIEKALEKAELKSLIALYETSKAIFSAVKLDDLLPNLIQLSIKLLKADDVSIMLFGEDKKLYIAASHGLNDEVKKGVRLEIGERVAGKVVEWKEPCIISGPLVNDSRFSDIKGRDEIKSSIILPLISKKNVIGVLCASRTGSDMIFNNADQRYANIFASQISQAIENAQLYKQLENKIEALNDAYSKLSEMQTELVQAEKLAAIGELASGVAHELNNPLTVVIGLVQLMLEEQGIPDEKKMDLETIKEQAERCRRIILNLLQFSRKHETQKALVDIESIIEKSLELVEYDLKTSGLIIERAFGSSEKTVEADPFQIQQVFLNIINNAFHASKDVKEPKLIIKTRKIGNRLQVSFADNGTGIPEDIIKRVFDPFFTTKDVNKGTGLGLSISYGIIKEHGGDIYVQSEVGKGSTFFIDLPCHGSKTEESHKEEKKERV